MSSNSEFVRFVADRANKSHAKQIIHNATADYDTSQDLTAFRKRALYVHRTMDNNSAVLLENTINNSNVEETVEAIFVVAGILIQSNLPPIRTKAQLPDQITSAAQEVSIIAADADHFDKAVAAIEDIRDMFGLEFPSGALKSADHNLFEGELGLTFGTRYFTPSHICKNDTGEKLPAEIDPLGILTKAARGKGKFLLENMVLYHQHKGAHSDTKWFDIEPSRFRLGQVVQLEVAFRVIPTSSKSHYRMVPLLRSLALLNSDIYTAWEQIIRSSKKPPTHRIQFKRSTAYYIKDEPTPELPPNKRARTEPADESAKAGEHSGEGGQHDVDDQMPFAVDYDDGAPVQG